jgi:hypothetical protein
VPETNSTVVTGIVRVVLLDRYDRHPPTDYNYSILFCLSTIEIGLSFIAACAPAMKPIVMKIIPKVFGNTSRSAAKYSKGATARLGYQLDQMSRHTQNGPVRTYVDAGAKDDDDSIEGDELPVQGVKQGIAVTTETEVRWHDSTKTSKNGSSTESLV